MKISAFIGYILLVSVFFFSFGLMVNDVNNVHDANINSSEWNQSYDFVQDLNETVDPLNQKFKVIQDEDEGFFTKAIASGFVVYYVVILFPQVVFGSLELGGEITTGFLLALAIPSYILTAALVMLLVWALFKMLEFFQGSEA